jgi:WD40 repeat protein
VALTRDGKLIASVAFRDPQVSVWNAGTESKNETFQRRDSNGARSVLFSEDGALLAEGNADLNVLVWSRTRHRSPLVLSGHDQPPSALAFLPGGTLLASSGGRKEPVRLWETGIGLAVGVLPVPGGSVEQLRFERNGSLLGATSDPAMLIRWRTATGHDVVEALRQAFEQDATTGKRELLVSALWALSRAEPGESAQALAEAKRLLDEAKLAGTMTSEEESWVEEIEYAAGTRETR